MYQMLVVLLLIVVASGEDTHPSCLDGCFFDSPESCPGPHEPFRCTISPTCSKAVICCNLTNDNILDELRNVSNGSKSRYRALHIMQSTFDSFNLSMTQWWRVLESFAVTNGAIRSFDTVFPKHTKQLSCLNLTSNGINELRNDSVKLCTNLNVLDVSRNKLKMLPAFASNQNITLDISNNSFQCDTLQRTIKNKPNLDFINANRTWCAQPDNNTWYNYSVYLGLTQIARINEIERVCPKNCTCKAHRVVVAPGYSLNSSISFAINCAEQQLTSLPSPLPDRTIALNVSVNNSQMDALTEWLGAIYIEEDTQTTVLSMALNIIEFANNILNNATFRRGIDSKTLTKYILNYQKGFTPEYQRTTTVQVNYKQIIGFLKKSDFMMIVKYCVHLLLRYVKATLNKQMFWADIEHDYLLQIVTTIADLSNIISNSNDFDSDAIVDEVLCFAKDLLDCISNINQKGYQYQISSLAPINTDASYKDLRELYAFHNNISSILPLESSKFISSFVALDLRHNNIKLVPTYMFMNTFDRNNNIRMVRLGQNRLKCDCDTAKIFKVWLSMAKLIEDSEEIFCEDTGKQVLSLDAAEMCQDELADNKQFWIDSIYYIIAAEIALLLILIAKVSYDYWVFKTTGNLPWPASKMPKLPCDWLCE